MKELMLSVINMSISGGIVIIAILLARLLLKKAPKKWSYLLWGAAAFRLCCPVSIKSAFSLFSFVPKGAESAEKAASAAGRLEYIPNVVRATQLPGPMNTPISNITPLPQFTPSALPTGVPTAAVNGAAASPSPTQGVIAGITENIGGAGDVGSSAQAATTVSFLQVLMTAVVVIWIVGMIALIAYSVIGYIKMYRKMSTAVRLEGNVYQSERVRSPFILGFIRPKIYIPYGLDAESKSYVLAHESYHLKRGDHIIKVFSFLLLALHWFNPLCWLAFYLSNKDMEMSCDEKVLGDKLDIRRQYSTTLLSFATSGQFPSASPLAFGESGVKSRIKNAMSYKKPRFIVTVIALVICLAVLAACVVNPTDNGVTPEAQEANASAEPTNAPTEAPTPAAPSAEPINPIITVETTAKPTAVPRDYVPAANITFVNRLGRNSTAIEELRVNDGVYGDPYASYYTLYSYEGQNTADFTLRHTEDISISAIVNTHDLHYNWIKMKYVIADFDAADGDTVELSDKKAMLTHADGSSEELTLLKYEYDESFVLGMNENLLHPIVTTEYIHEGYGSTWEAPINFYCKTISLSEAEAAKYPNLAAALNALNEAAMERSVSEYEDLCKEVLESGEEDPWRYAGNSVAAIRRADSNVLSFIMSKNRHRQWSDGSEYILWSENFDTAAGKALQLGDVVNDTALLAELLNMALAEAGITGIGFEGGVPAPDGEYAWSIDHDGISFFFNKGAFNTNCDHFSLFIPFEMLGGNFKREYLPATEDYIIEFIDPNVFFAFENPFEEHFTVNGKVESVALYSKHLDLDHDECFDMFIHANGRDYLVYSGVGDGGWNYADALLLLGGGKVCELNGIVEYINRHNTDPGLINARTTVFPLGNISGSIPVSFNCDGETVWLSSEVSTNHSLTMLKDFETTEIDMNGSAIGPFVLKTGQKIVVFRAASDYADARTDDGHIVRILKNTADLFETFDGISTEG